MSIATEIARFQKAKTDIKSAIENKGVTVGNGTISTYASKINQITGGEGGGFEYAPVYVDFSEYAGTDMSSCTTGLYTYNMTTMDRMFYRCSNVTSLDVSNFDTSKVTDMSWMFRECSNLTSLDLSSFDTTNVTDMSYMFYKDTSLTTLDLSNFNTELVTTTASMFYGCSALTSVDLSGFGNMRKTTTFGNMFDACTNLKFIDMRNITFRSSATTSNMFRSVPTDCLIIVKDDTAKTWITSKFTTLTNVKTLAEYEASL